MKKSLLLIVWLLACVLASKAQFTSGRLAVCRVGTGHNVPQTTSTTTVFIDEYDFAGNRTYSKSIDSTASGLTMVGATSFFGGYITLSSDRNFLVVPGFHVAKTTTIATAYRNTVVGKLNASGTLVYIDSNMAGSTNRIIHSAASDGTNFWAGNYTTTGGGVYLGAGKTTTVSTTPVSVRSISIYANQLFASTTATAGSEGIWKVGTGTPTDTGNISTPYINVTGQGTGTPDPWQFSFNPDTSICYIADARSLFNGGGVQKWVRSGSTWSLSYTLTMVDTANGARGLTVDWTGANPVIYGTSAAKPGNTIFKITDTGSLSTAVILASASANTVFRGIAFTPGSTNGLPVKWLLFSAKKGLNNVLLNWQTASEVNNAHFEIEKSRDGKTFAKTGTVKGAGNSNVILDYSFSDNEISNANTIFYRIKQVDLEGRCAYSNVVTVNHQPAALNQQLSVFPNPAKNEITLRNIPANGAIITDIMGKTIMQIAQDGTYKVEALKSGMYFIVLEEKAIKLIIE